MLFIYYVYYDICYTCRSLQYHTIKHAFVGIKPCDFACNLSLKRDQLATSSQIKIWCTYGFRIYYLGAVVSIVQSVVMLFIKFTLAGFEPSSTRLLLLNKSPSGSYPRGSLCISTWDRSNKPTAGPVQIPGGDHLISLSAICLKFHRNNVFSQYSHVLTQDSPPKESWIFWYPVSRS